MPVNIEDRPIENVREAVIDQLIMNYGHGEISLEAFERRLDQAMSSTCNKELLSLVEDLDLNVDQDYVDSKKQDMGTNYMPGHTQAQETITNILSSSNRQGPWKVPKEINLKNYLSSADLDFTEAVFSHPEVRINTFSLFSACTIYVPENVRVISNLSCIAGRIDNRSPSQSHSRSPSQTNNKTPTIYIEGTSVFSSINIEVKRTMKERFVAFADGLKRMLS
ncbi:MAG: DUF1707 and DUF2154 domain-containing protein [Algicola sp.]|nr:DUF1707 and DUF2154 domain-containing protein [Algicola sp.]